MELLNNYHNALQAIYDHVGFRGDTQYANIGDETGHYWTIERDRVIHADTERAILLRLNYEIAGIHEESMAKGEWMFKGELFTIIICDPLETDEKCLTIFDNSKRIEI